jgi:2-polyprenyl-3-methyl-5-hydroxy-6-metoxy-1,4-benzoquinol methylase
VTRYSDLIPPGGAILDVACGGGRHTRWYLEQGRSVVAMDRDLSPIAELLPHPNLEAVEADLEDGRPFPLLGRSFAAVVCTNYLHRPLQPLLVAAVAPGGVLLYETFMEGHEAFGRPTRPEFLLHSGELRAAVKGQLTVVAHEEVTVARPRPARVQHIAAVRPTAG